MKKDFAKRFLAIVVVIICLASIVLNAVLWSRYSQELSVERERADSFESYILETSGALAIILAKNAEKMELEINKLASGEITFHEFSLILEHRNEITHNLWRICLAAWNIVTASEEIPEEPYIEIKEQIERVIAALCKAPEEFSSLDSDDLLKAAEDYGSLSNNLVKHKDSIYFCIINNTFDSDSLARAAANLKVSLDNLSILLPT